jgi:penicillin-binding protein 1A
MTSRWWFYPALAALSAILLPALLLLFAAILTYPTLPTLEVLTDYRPKVPLRIYSADGALLGEFGEERRALVAIGEVPDLMKKAILAAEDDRFYQHGGVDYLGVLRAALSNFTSDSKQGASTITMQVARNFFLTKEKTVTRKFNEMLLAFKIEHSLSKDEIFQLYINHIYLGQRAYGFAAAAQIYFGKPLDQLHPAEMAMLAGLPKAPSTYNPVANPKRAKLRQMYVLRRMHELKFIDDATLKIAQVEPMQIKHGYQSFPVRADFLAEMVRQEVYERFQEATYTQGYVVYTTLRQADQQAAYAAVRRGVIDYDHRHGYRGPEGFFSIGPDSDDEVLEDALHDISASDDILPAIVRRIEGNRVVAYCKGGEIAEIGSEGIKFAQRAFSDKTPLNQRIRVGSIIRVQLSDKGVWQITQLPQVEAAFISGSPQTGAIHALVGGFDFSRNKFNHITQAWRQPGSSIKPFIYSAALEKGITPATIIQDAPLTFDAAQTGSEAWSPKNYDGKFDGPMRVREALVRSKNLVSVRIMQAISPEFAREHLARFGFDPEKHPPYLTTALGAGSVTPMEMMVGYATFANGGYRISPYFIERIEDGKGNVLSRAKPVVAGETAEQVIDVRNAYTMNSMMQDVVRRGTAARAMQLGRYDLAGKTGTTSDAMDAWFCGFQASLVGISWIGYDTPRTLGEKETGGVAALPIWMSYMEKALKDVPQVEYQLPERMVAVQISQSGRRDSGGELTEYFYEENQPAAESLLDAIAKPLEALKDKLLSP